MSEVLTAQKPEPNLANILAKERNRAAAERTLLAWIRTSLSLISFGFAIYKIIHTFAAEGTQKHPMTFLLAVCFILLGTLTMISATIQHIQILKQLQLEDDPYKPRRPIAVYVSFALTAIGLIALATVVVEALFFKR